ncbi:Hypothetical protein LUCI_3221 [Lucifera butyrica]|uniref:Uncharacterized protein n=1 Tax=Lucifera butyrica TaxID=1351585 RepID=A0A498R5F8_9FIRM|nr:hypothetical protein [Lucifera butyrica]VBB07956.1 Hypothetical protein LUCI_3221 [Lucifera butyrica]
MRIAGMVLLLLMICFNQAYAISPINKDTIQAAQDYGKKYDQMNWNDFSLDWTSYEENAAKLNAATERAYFYTPFLLIAADARDKTLKKLSVTLEDSEKIITDYTGFWVFSVTLFGDNINFTQDGNAVLQQGPKLLKASQSVIPSEASPTGWNSKDAAYMAQCYFYFSAKDLSSLKPVILAVTTGNKKVRRFYFDIAKIR